MPRPPALRSTLTGLLAAVCLFGAALALPVSAQGTRLEREVRSILRQASLRSDDASVTVLDATGRRIVAIRPAAPMKPASNLKILTTVGGLGLLGPGHEYVTRLRGEGPVEDGVLAGDVVLHGTGDPNISDRFHDEPVTLFRVWARRLREEAGLERITGDLLVDDSYFDEERFNPTWKRNQMGRWYSAEVSSLNLNDNCVDVRIVPGRPGSRARVEVRPESPFIHVHGAPRTVHAGSDAVTIRRKVGTNEITIGGTVRAGIEEWRDHVAIHDPALFFAHTLARVWREEGLAIEGSVRRLPSADPVAASGEDDVERGATGAPGGASGAGAGPGGGAPGGPGSGSGGEGSGGGPRSGGGDPRRAEPRPATATEEGAPLLVEHRSSLRLDLPVINQRSQNLHAEVLLKAVGAAEEGEGSVAAGARAIRGWLEDRGVPVEGLEMADGSGLSHANRVTTGLLAGALHAARGESWFGLFRDSLAVAGETGTLDDRFPTHPALHGRVRAKTGYILGASGLSGYVRRGDRLWTFSTLFSRLPGGNHRIKRVQEDIVAAIDAALARAPGG